MGPGRVGMGMPVARVGDLRMTGGAGRAFGLGLVCGWERGDVDDSWAVRKMTKQSWLRKGLSRVELLLDQFG